MSSESPSLESDTRGKLTPETGVEPEGIDTPTLLMWGFVSVVLVVCVMLVSAALFYQVQNDLDQRVVIAKKYPDSEKIYTDQLGVLTSYKAPEAEGQAYHIPIGRAMELVVDEYAERAQQ
ncbi:hypothetical protein [Botrimarina sp.]|uniref:hypothetical protein n=1 Tax=Botrimarina sp. TaxID=2795802 RepID=UPI0032EF41DA